MAFNPQAQQRLLTQVPLDPEGSLRSAVCKGTPWDSIVDFACHRSFCGQRLYPRQATLLKLLFLETENMTAYDIDVVEGWRTGFSRHREVFGVQPDIWQRIEYLKARGYRRFPHVQMVLGRRASKGFLGGILGAEQIAYLLSLDDFQAHYGIRTGKECYGNIGATSQTVAMRQQFKDILQIVEDCTYLQPHIAEAKDHILAIRTPADLRRIAEMKTADIPIDHQVASLRVVPLSASSTSGRGSTSFFNVYDEFAHMIYGTQSVKSGSEIYEDWQPNLGQFKQDALTLVSSSPFTRVGKFYELYQHGKVLMSTYRDNEGISEEALGNLRLISVDDPVELTAEPTWIIFQGPSWELYQDWQQARIITGPNICGRGGFKSAPEPDLTDEVQMRRRRRNPEKFAVERLGQFAEVMGQYLDRDKVAAMFAEPGWRAPLEPQSRGYLTRSYRSHCDPGRTGANFAMCVAHLEDAPPDEHGQVWPHVIVDLLKVWRPEDFPLDPETSKATIDYVAVQDDIDDVLFRFPSTAKVSFDQWNSAGMIASLRRKYSPGIRVAEVTFTEKDNQARFERFKTALNLGWVHSYADNFYDNGGSLLEMELLFLAEHRGKVIKQDVGPVTTKDLADCLVVCVTDLLHTALDRYAPGEMPALRTGSTNVISLRSGKEFERLAASGKVRDPEVAARNLDAIRTWGKTTRDRRASYAPSRASSIHARNR